MSVTSGFFNSLNGDRKYSAEQFSELISTLVTDGVFSNVGTAFAVTASGENRINIGIGRAWFNGVWLYNDALFPMTVRDAEVLLDRIDAVVIEINHSESVRAGSIKLVLGTPSGEPVEPELTNTDEVHQYPLAYIYRHAGVNTVSQADITNKIGTSACPYITGILETQNIDKIVAQWESEFGNWFEDLQGILEGDPATNLANEILELQSRFETLAKEQSVYSALSDTAGDELLDSSGRSISGKTYLGAKSKSEVVVIDKGGKDSFKVGDILSTARIDLGDNWLLCNGSEINIDEYPELVSVLPTRMPDKDLSIPEYIFKRDLVNFDSPSSNTSQTPIVYSDIKYINEKYICVGFRTSGSSNYINIAYSDYPSGPWTHVDIDSSSYDDYFVSSIIFANGYYILVGGRGNQSLLAYSRNLDGPWTAKYGTIFSGTSGYSDTHINSIIYENGYYIVAGYELYKPKIAYSKGLNGPWTNTSDFSELEVGFTKIMCLNGYYLLFSTDNLIFYAESLGGPWSSIDPFLGGSVASAIYVGGKYIFCGSDSSKRPAIAYSETLAGPWTVKSFENVGVHTSGKFLDIVYNGEYYFLVGYASKSYLNELFAFGRSIDDLTGWTIYCLTDNTSSGYYDFLESCKYVNGILLITAVHYSASSDVISSYVYYVDFSKISLPEISLSNTVYSYIKVKEG